MHPNSLGIYPPHFLARRGLPPRQHNILPHHSLSDLGQTAMPHNQIRIIRTDALKVCLCHLSREIVSRLQVGFAEKGLEHLATDAVQLAPADCLRCVNPRVWSSSREIRFRAIVGIRTCVLFDKYSVDTEDHPLFDDHSSLTLTDLFLLVMCLIFTN